MTQTTDTTDTDIRDLKTAVEANTKSIADLVTSITGLREEMRTGFSDIKTSIAVMDTRLKEVESKIDKQESRLWAFAAIVLTATLGALWKLLTTPGA